MARELANAVETEAAVIAAMEGENRVHPLGTWSQGRPLPRVVWNLATPVAAMITTGKRATGKIDASSCSEAAVLEMEVEGYAAVPLIDSRGNVIGFAAALSREPLSLSSEQEAALRIIAVRATAELERLRLEDSVASANELARSLTTAIDDGVITIDDRGVIVAVNDAVIPMFGYSREELTGANVSLLMPEPHVPPE